LGKIGHRSDGQNWVMGTQFFLTPLPPRTTEEISLLQLLPMMVMKSSIMNTKLLLFGIPTRKELGLLKI
jgi:hypothetical protein